MAMVGCAAGQNRTEPSSSTPEKTVSITPTILAETDPKLEVIEFTILQTPELGRWNGVGILENTSQDHLRDLRVILADEDLTSEIERIEIRAALENLAPGERSPFIVSADTPINTALPSLGVEALNYYPLERGDVVAEDLISIQLPNGEPGLHGIMRNKSYLHIAIHSLAILARSDSGDPVAIGEYWAGPTHLPPRRSAPFIAAFSNDLEHDSYEVFIDSTEVDDPGDPQIQFSEGPTVRTTEQGQTFLTGMLRNETSQPHQLSMTILAKSDERVIGLVRIEQPVPHLPNEARPFSVSLSDHFSSLVPGMEWTDAEEFEAVIDAHQTNEVVPSPAPLDLQINQFEVIGSTLFLRGSLSNPLEVRLVFAAVLGSLRTPEGIVQSAGWYTHPTPLDPHESIEFTLSMPIPADFQPAEGEFDLQALGVLGP
jgi:hypothetical protein